MSGDRRSEGNAVAGAVGTIRRLHDEEEGTIALATVVAVLFFLVLLGLVANIGQAVRQKVESQNAADAVAISAATAKARGLNAITAINHLLGELEAMVVIHHAIGGPELDAGRPPQQDQTYREIKAELEIAHTAAEDNDEEPSPESSIWDTVSQDLQDGDGATLHDSFLRLKKVMSWVYWTYAIGGFLKDLQPIPIVGEIAFAIGEEVSAGAKIFEMKVYLEWQILVGLRTLAQGLVGVKKLIDEDVIPDLYQVEALIVAEIPSRARAVRDEVARANNVAAGVYPIPSDLGGLVPGDPAPVFQVPVHPEPDAVEPAERSQLVRAAFPWVAFWRVPIRARMKEWLILSHATRYYLKYTNLYMLQKAREQKQRGVQLNVLLEYQPGASEKGEEPWTTREGSDRADELFGIVGFARRPSPAVLVAGIYPRMNEDGILTYAQALAYNANPQLRGSGGGGLQPSIGWDTLNWSDAVAECPAEGNETAESAASGRPAIKLNWQAKLVPARSSTLLKAAAAISIAEPELGRVLRKALPFLPLDPFLTH